MNKILKSIAITTISIIYGLGNYSLAAISKVKVNFNQNLLFIYGEDLTHTITDSLTVTLGNTNLTVCPNCYSATEITADLPTGLIDGDYMLKVASYGRASVNAGSGWLHNEYNLTVGAVGPQGLPGADGQDGAQGIQGIQGEKGDKGDQGIQGIQGVKGDKGDKGDQGDQGIQGLRGLPGADGVDGEAGNLALAGQVCSGTAVPKGFDSNGDIVCGYTSSTAVNYGRGKAIVPHWGVNVTSVTVIHVSNITEHNINVSITLYNDNGTVEPVSTYYNFINNNTQIAPKSTAQFIVRSSSTLKGFAVIEWQNEGTDNDDVALVAYGIRVLKSESSVRSDVAIPINNGLPF